MTQLWSEPDLLDTEMLLPSAPSPFAYDAFGPLSVPTLPDSSHRAEADTYSLWSSPPKFEQAVHLRAPYTNSPLISPIASPNARDGRNPSTRTRTSVDPTRASGSSSFGGNQTCFPSRTWESQASMPNVLDAENPVSGPGTVAAQETTAPDPDSTKIPPTLAAAPSPLFDIIAKIDAYGDDLHQTAIKAQTRPWPKGYTEVHKTWMYGRQPRRRRPGTPPLDFEPPDQTSVVGQSHEVSPQVGPATSASTSQSEPPTHSPRDGTNYASDDDVVMSDTGVPEMIEMSYPDYYGHTGDPATDKKIYDSAEGEGLKGPYAEMEAQQRAKEDEGYPPLPALEVDGDVDMHHVHDTSRSGDGDTNARDPDIRPFDPLTSAAYDAVTIAGNVDVPPCSSSPDLVTLPAFCDSSLGSDTTSAVLRVSTGGRGKNVSGRRTLSPRNQRYKKRKNAPLLPSSSAASPCTRSKSFIMGKMSHVRGTITRETNAQAALKNQLESKRKRVVAPRATSRSSSSTLHSVSSTAQQSVPQTTHTHVFKDGVWIACPRVLDQSDFVRRSTRQVSRATDAAIKQKTGADVPSELSAPFTIPPVEAVDEALDDDDNDDNSDEEEVEETTASECGSDYNSDDEDFQPPARDKLSPIVRSAHVVVDRRPAQQPASRTTAAVIIDSEDRPFKCSYPECNKAFRRSHDRDRHIGTHDDKKDHMCLGCRGKFKRKDALNRHLRSCRKSAKHRETQARREKAVSKEAKMADVKFLENEFKRGNNNDSEDDADDDA